MEIITRQQAIASRLTSYFTGVACKRGHIAKRYTRTSVCSDCLHPKFETVESRARAKKKTMVLKKFKLRDENLESFKLTVWALGTISEPLLKPEDFLSNRKVLFFDQGIRIHPFWIFPQDEPFLRNFEQQQFPPKPETEEMRRFRENGELIAKVERERGQ